MKRRAVAILPGLAAYAFAAHAPGTLPQAVASFGAVADSGWLYVYGGHIAPTHVYSTEAVSGEFHRVNLSGPGTWETLPPGPPMQGMNLAAYKGKIYRIGGMTPQNPPDQPADIHSITDCARFDPATRTWEALPPLPGPRSSHDVVVIGSKLIATGGWNLRGSEPMQWVDTIAVMDLDAPHLQWTTAPQPFTRRAITAAAYRGRMFVLGGLDEKGQIVLDVNIYDPRDGQWTKGPALPGGGIRGFSPATGVYEDNLYASLADGALCRLNEAAGKWDEAGKTSARMAHRMAASADGLWILGGAIDGHNLDLIETVRLSAPQTAGSAEPQ